MARSTKGPRPYFATKHGTIFHGDSLDVLRRLDSRVVDLIVTSPPYGLIAKKEYGNVHADDYLKWFEPFATEFKRVLKKRGSLVIDIGGAWNAGAPTRHLYHFKLLVMLCEKFGFHLAQEMFWWNPSKLPSPAEWVTVKRVRVKDAVNCVWWLSPTENPKADNRKVLQPYSASMAEVFENGSRTAERPSGHEISKHFETNNGAAIPPNLLAIANTNSKSRYLRGCAENRFKPHPARFPAELPEFFIRMLTEEGDLVVDPFGGSCVTGEVCERLNRKWICSELREDYLQGAVLRFPKNTASKSKSVPAGKDQYYQLAKLGIGWDFIESHKKPKGKRNPKIQDPEANA